MKSIILDFVKWLLGIESSGIVIGIPKDQKIPADKLEKAAKADGKLGRMARLAKNMRSFKH